MSKIEKLFFYLFIFSIPFQTRWIVYQWGTSFNEWSSAYIYFTDILLIFVFILWFWRKKTQRYLKERPRLNIDKPIFWLVVFVLISFISIIKAENIGLSFYSWFKLLEMVGLFFYIKSNLNQGLINFRRICQVFVFSSLFQSVIIIWQYLGQASLGLKFLAESPFNANMLGVAKIVVNDLKIVRPYGTFPHPNVLAAFLLLNIFFLFYLWLSREHFLSNYFFFIFLSLLLFSLIISYSRTIIFAFLTCSILYLILSLWRVIQTTDLALFKRIILLLLIFIILSSLLFYAAWPEISSRFNISSSEEAVTLRAFYNQTALEVIQESPFLGLGIGNFVWRIKGTLYLLGAWLHQPVHNIYLLIASEVGLIGLVIFLLFLYQLIDRLTSGENHFILKYLLFFIIISFLFIGFFDHFFLTLQQGQLIFWIILGIIASDLKYIS